MYLFNTKFTQYISSLYLNLYSAAAFFIMEGNVSTSTEDNDTNLTFMQVCIHGPFIVLF